VAVASTTKPGVRMQFFSFLMVLEWKLVQTLLINVIKDKFILKKNLPITDAGVDYFQNQFCCAFNFETVHHSLVNHPNYFLSDSSTQIFSFSTSESF